MASQTLRTLKLSLLADVSNFGKEMNKAGTSFQKFSRGVEQASRFATAAVGAIGALGVSAVNAASDFDETSSAVNQVFGPAASRQLQQFAANAAQALGQSRQAALEASQSFGIFGTAAGLSGDELVEFTTDLVTLASDLASFNNTDVDTAITALGAALRGESEPIRQFGVLLDAATLKQRALAEGIIETTEQALTPQQKTLAAYAEILAQTELQQGDFARTSDGLANSQRILQAELENFRIELGEQLLPVVQELLPRLRGFVGAITAIEPDKLVRIGTAIAGVATSIVTLNAALKGFAAVQGAWRVLTGLGVGGGIAGVAGVAAGITAVTGQNLAPGQATGGLTPGGLGLGGGGGRPTPPTPPRPPDRERSITVNGVVGSPYQVFRELERIENTGRRYGAGAVR